VPQTTPRCQATRAQLAPASVLAGNAVASGPPDARDEHRGRSKGTHRTAGAALSGRAAMFIAGVGGPEGDGVYRSTDAAPIGRASPWQRPASFGATAKNLYVMWAGPARAAGTNEAAPSIKPRLNPAPLG